MWQMLVQVTFYIKSGSGYMMCDLLALAWSRSGWSFLWFRFWLTGPALVSTQETVLTWSVCFSLWIIDLTHYSKASLNILTQDFYTANIHYYVDILIISLRKDGFVAPEPEWRFTVYDSILFSSPQLCIFYLAFPVSPCSLSQILSDRSVLSVWKHPHAEWRPPSLGHCTGDLWC